jgi:hypothetical protein
MQHSRVTTRSLLSASVRRRGRLVVLIAIGVLVASAIAVALWLGHSDEPGYKGKRMSSWLDELYYSRSGEANQATVAAVRAIGTNGVPYLLHLLTNRPNALILRSYRLANILVVERLHWRKKYFGMLEFGRGYAVEGFRCLGHSGSNAIPTLLTWLSDADIGIAAALSLCNIGRPAVPAVIEVLTNGTPFSRLNVAGNVHRIGPDALPVVPVLLPLMKDNNANLRHMATISLALLHLEPSLVVPALTEALSDSNSGTRFWALKGLGNFGSLASNSLPAVASRLTDSALVVRIEATNCLKAIERSCSNPP